MRAALRPLRLFSPRRLPLSGDTTTGRCPLLLGLALLVVTAFGCNSGNSDADASHPPARVDQSADGGAFRNLGKRSAFDYGSVDAGAAAQR